jgi:hypothetical protein
MQNSGTSGPCKKSPVSWADDYAKKLARIVRLLLPGIALHAVDVLSTSTLCLSGTAREVFVKAAPLAAVMPQGRKFAATVPQITFRMVGKV